MKELSKPINKTNKDPKKASHGPAKEPVSKKQSRKGENPRRIPSANEQKNHSPSICQNSACRAFMSQDAAFCRRCSCCICHLFDDNKDPSLWLVCSSESRQEDSCGLSCHIECALKNRNAGVSDRGQLMQLDGSYCCVSCGKVSEILGCWKKQLAVAKEARRLDILCYRILLSYRLLSGTSRFKELHEIVKEAKAKLEAEVGPLNGFLPRSLVSRLSVAEDVQKLCLLGIEKAEQWMVKHSDHSCRAPMILFEEVRPSSVTIILINMSDSIKGYKLWYCKSKEDSFSEKPNLVTATNQRRVLISNLQPRTKYTFRVVSFTESGELGQSEVKCSTRSSEGRGGSRGFGGRDLGPEPAPKVEKSFGLDLNIASMPDLNEEFGDEEEEEDKARPKVPVMVPCRKRASGTREDPHDCDSILINGSGSPGPISKGPGFSDESFEYCVKTVRRLECGGHIDPDFRLKFLTWFSLRAADQERRVVNTFVQAMVDDPSSLAGQLIDSFSEMVSSKKPKNGLNGLVH